MTASRELIKCKDCIYYNKAYLFCVLDLISGINLNEATGKWHDYDFCSKAKLPEEEDE